MDNMNQETLTAKSQGNLSFSLGEAVLPMPNHTARQKVFNVLNDKKPQHLPDIYFVRRDKRLLGEYLKMNDY
jgi:hypothetical protein